MCGAVENVCIENELSRVIRLVLNEQTRESERGGRGGGERRKASEKIKRVLLMEFCLCIAQSLLLKENIRNVALQCEINKDSGKNGAAQNHIHAQLI